MSWLRLDDGFVEHPKVAGLSDSAFRLHVAALCYCARNLTDGLISRLALRSVGANANLTRAGTTASTLVRAGLWVVEDDGYRIHHYLAYNPAKRDVERNRGAARERMAKIRSGEHVANGSRARSGERSRTPSHPLSYSSKGFTATQQAATIERVARMIDNGVLTDQVSLDAELRGAGINGATAQELAERLAGIEL